MVSNSSVPNENSSLKRPFRLSFSVAQFGVFLLFIFGALASVFYLGFSAGQKAGLETALSNSLASAVKIPIDLGQTQGAPSENFVDVYNKLKEPSEKARVKEVPAVPEVVQEVQEPDTAAIEPVDNKTETKLAEDNIDAIKKALLGANGEGDLVPEFKAAKGLEEKPIEAVKAPAKEELEVVKPETTAKKVEKFTTIEEKPKLDKVVPTIQPTKPAAQSVSNVKSGWYVQIAAPKSEADAQAITRQLKGSGFVVAIEKATVRSESYYRVLVGPESKREYAERILSQVKRERYITGAPFLRKVQ